MHRYKLQTLPLTTDSIHYGGHYLEYPNQDLRRDFLLLSFSNTFSTCSAPSLKTSSAIASLSFRYLTFGDELILLIEFGELLYSSKAGGGGGGGGDKGVNVFGMQRGLSYEVYSGTSDKGPSEI